MIDDYGKLTHGEMCRLANDGDAKAKPLLDEGVDISTIADLMGHTDPSITKGYDRRDEGRKMDAIT